MSEVLQFWQPQGIEILSAPYTSSLVLESVFKGRNEFELIISDFKQNKIKLIYNKLSSADFTVWSFIFDTEDARIDLTNIGVEVPEDYNKYIPKFFKVKNSKLLAQYEGNHVFEKAMDKVEVHMYITLNEIVTVVSEHEPVIVRIE
ncbi:hypothetical protein LG326_01860 [Metaplanococcus flavidus]